MSIDAAQLAVPFLLGIVLGVVYLAALWAATRRLARSPWPMAGLLGGAVLRIAVLLGLFYLAANGDGVRVLAVLAGFVVVRVAVTRWVSRGAPATPNR